MPTADLPSFTTIKKWILEAARDSNTKMSVRHAKKLAGDYLTQNDPDYYKRITHADPVGEGVAKRWTDFRHQAASLE